MKIDEWKEKPCTMPLWQFLRSIHYFTELVKIHVVIGDAWLDEREKGHRLHDFDLTEDAFNGIRLYSEDEDKNELNRLLEYYADAPVWNITADFTTIYDHRNYKGERIPGEHITSCISARVYFKDIRDAWYREQADIRRKKRREYNQQRRKNNGKSDLEP